MGAIGPVSLGEVRDVLADRLRTVAVEPPDNRYGRVFVGTADAGARADVPRRLRPRARRAPVPAEAPRGSAARRSDSPRGRGGAADAGRSRRGRAPPPAPRRRRRHRARVSLVSARRAARGASARAVLLRPRRDPRDDGPRPRPRGAAGGSRQRDARVARVARAARSRRAPWTTWSTTWRCCCRCSKTKDPLSVKGRAHYLLGLNDHLRRVPHGALAAVEARLDRLRRPRQAHRRRPRRARGPEARRASLSLTALQRYSVCPYQFLLAAIYRLEPFEEPTPLQRLDPLTKGGLFHQVQAAFFRERQKRKALPITPANLAESLEAIDARSSEGRGGASVRSSRPPSIACGGTRLPRSARTCVAGSCCRPKIRDPWTPERFELTSGFDRRRPRSAQRRRAGHGGRAVRPARLDRSRRAPRRVAHAARHRSQDGEEPHRGDDDGERREDAAARALQPGGRADDRRARGFRPALLLHARRGKFTAIPCSSVRSRATPASGAGDRGPRRSSSASLPRARRKARARTATSVAVCGPLEERRARRKNPGALADLKALRDLP